MLISELQNKILAIVQAIGPLSTDQIVIPDVEPDAIYHQCVSLGKGGFLDIRHSDLVDDDSGFLTVLGLTTKGIQVLESRRGPK